MCVLVVGSLNMDTTLRMDHFPEKGETIMAYSLNESRGGKGQNQAVAISRQGIKVKMIGMIGDDENGEAILAGLLQDGVDIGGLMKAKEPTGVASIYLDKKGNNNIVVYPGANYNLTATEIEKNLEYFEDVKICVMQMEIPLDVIYRTLEICKEKGITTILNPAPANSNIDYNILCLVDYIIPNESELSILTNMEVDNENTHILAKQLLSKGCKTVIVTMGEKGSMLVDRTGVTKVKSNRVEVIDTTAAGDSYIGGFVASLARGKTNIEAMEYATKVASIAVTRKGAITSIPYFSEVG